MTRQNDQIAEEKELKTVFAVTRFREIRYGGWLSEEYGRLVEPAYREQAASVIQDFVRERRRQKGKSVSVAKHEFRPIAADNSKKLALIRESTDNSYLTHIEKIKQGKYLELDYSDPEFIRNLFKALRLNTINQNQMLMAHSIYQAKEWLHDYNYPSQQLHEFEFSDPNGPYQVSGISYVTKQQLVVFQRNLKKEDQKYITINFSFYEEYLFLHHGLKSTLVYKDFFKKFLNNYIEHSFLDEVTKKVFNEKIKNVENKDINDIQEILLQAYLALLENFTQKKFSKDFLTQYVKDNIFSKEVETISFLIAILKLTEQNPGCVLSPDYKKKDSCTPTIAFVLMTLEAEKQLQLAVHNKEATLPAPTAGMVNTRMIRALDERPTCSNEAQKKGSDGNVIHQKRKLTEEEIAQIRNAPVSAILQAVYGKQYSAYFQQARPIEITHPDLNKTSKPHDFNSYDFMLFWHDRFHCWRGGANFKRYLRYERDLFTRKGVCQQKDFVMSKAIWELSDIDFSFGRELRSVKNRGVWTYVGKYFFQLMYRLDIEKSYDLMLLHLIHFIKNSARLVDFFVEITPDFPFKKFEDFLMRAALAWRIYLSQEMQFMIADSELKKLILKNLKDKTNESIILRCKLKNTPIVDKLCDLVDEIGIEKFFYWGMNSGLYFQDSYRSDLKKYLDIENFALDHFDEDLLLIALLICIKKIQSKEAYPNKEKIELLIYLKIKSPTLKIDRVFNLNKNELILLKSILDENVFSLGISDLISRCNRNEKFTDIINQYALILYKCSCDSFKNFFVAIPDKIFNKMNMLIFIINSSAFSFHANFYFDKILSVCDTRKNYKEVLIALIQSKNITIGGLKNLLDFLNENPKNFLREEQHHYFGFGVFGSHGNTNSYQTVVREAQNKVCDLLRSCDPGAFSSLQVHTAKLILELDPSRLPGRTVFFLDSKVNALLEKHSSYYTPLKT